MGLLSKSTGPPSPEEFAKLLLNRLQAAGDQRQARFDPGEFRLYFTKDGEDTGITFLGNFYREFSGLSESDQPAWWSRVIRGVLSYEKSIPDEFEDAKPDLRPAVRSRSHVELLRLDQEIKGEPLPDVPFLPIGDGRRVAVACPRQSTIYRRNKRRTALLPQGLRTVRRAAS